MKKQNRILTALLTAAIAAVLIISSSAEETLAAAARPGIYRGKTVELQISGITSTSKRSDFHTITFYDGKRYKNPLTGISASQTNMEVLWALKTNRAVKRANHP